MLLSSIGEIGKEMSCLVSLSLMYSSNRFEDSLRKRNVYIVE